MCLLLMSEACCGVMRASFPESVTCLPACPLWTTLHALGRSVVQSRWYRIRSLPSRVPQLIWTALERSI